MSVTDTDLLAGLQQLEGVRVTVTLADGSQLDDVELVSAGRGKVDSLWLDLEGVDLFVRKGEVVDLHRVTPKAA